jgi:NAD(P)-dependent dehydrogenase (short-subunit alcohol dehydrogenase family)
VDPVDETIMTEKKIALVTGASSGFGLLTAERLAAKGFRVFGTSRNPQAVPHVPGLEMLELDVRSDDSVAACIERLTALAQRVDLLVNNAGREHASVAEETALEHAHDVFETNFWGVVRVTNAVLPGMRKQRSGQIINVGSLAGLMGVPGQAFYSASKFALEGYTETLRIEIGPFGIHVSLIEPGFFKTNLNRDMLLGTHLAADYDALRPAVTSAITHAILDGGDPREVADMIAHVAGQPSPRLRYRVGNDAVWLPRLKAILPQSLFQGGMRRRFKLP